MTNRALKSIGGCPEHHVRGSFSRRIHFWYPFVHPGSSSCRNFVILSPNRFWKLKISRKIPDFEGDDVVQMQNKHEK